MITTLHKEKPYTVTSTIDSDTHKTVYAKGNTSTLLTDLISTAGKTFDVNPRAIVSLKITIESCDVDLDKVMELKELESED